MSKFQKNKKIPNRLPLTLLGLLLAVFGATCAPSVSAESENPPQGSENMKTVLITANGKTFTAAFYDTAAVRTLTAKMPLSITMSDMNRNEKYFNLGENLPSLQTERPATIRAGEIMCWSGSTLVLFYKTFSNSYGGYVRLGYVENTAELAAALGAGSVRVTFSLPANLTPDSK